MTTLKEDINAAIAAGELTGSETDQEILNWYETDVTRDRYRTAGDVWSVLALHSDFSFAALKNAADDPAHQAQELALRAWALLSDRDKIVDATDATEKTAFDAALDQLVSTGFMSTTHKDVVLAIFTETVKRSVARGVGRVTERDIHEARL